MKLLWRYYNYLKTWRKHRDTIKTLNQLSNRELRDIGLNRADIDDMIWLQEDKEKRGNK